MHDNLDNRARRVARRSRRIREIAMIAVGVIAAGVMVAACGSSSNGPGVASAGTSTGAARSAPGHPSKGSALAYSSCMRAHGITDFPDPNSSGGFAIQAPPGTGLDPNNPLYKAASQACKSLQPTAPTSGAGQARLEAALLRFARCMRAHGLKSFPDPQGNGTLSLKATPGSGLDLNNPQDQAAQRACQSELPGGAGPAQTGSRGGGTP